MAKTHQTQGVETNDLGSKTQDSGWALRGVPVSTMVGPRTSTTNTLLRERGGFGGKIGRILPLLGARGVQRGSPSSKPKRKYRKKSNRTGLLVGGKDQRGKKGLHRACEQ